MEYRTEIECSGLGNYIISKRFVAFKYTYKKKTRAQAATNEVLDELTKKNQKIDLII